MKPNQLSAYTAHRAGILITGKIDLNTLYNGYTAFCRSRGETPEPYEVVEKDLAHEIHSIKLWWSATEPHIVETIIGSFVSIDLDTACQPT